MTRYTSKLSRKGDFVTLCDSSRFVLTRYRRRESNFLLLIGIFGEISRTEGKRFNEAKEIGLEEWHRRMGLVRSCQRIMITIVFYLPKNVLHVPNWPMRMGQGPQALATCNVYELAPLKWNTKGPPSEQEVLRCST